MDLGLVTNNATDVNAESESQIEILFEVQTQIHDNFVEGQNYKISVGVMFGSSDIASVSEDDLTYQEYTPAQVNSLSH